jgi:hypothetical protein
MKLISDTTYERLIRRADRADELEQKLERLRVRHQQVILEAGLQGFTVEVKPEVPAQPARMVLRKKH